jgi:hypothetical protein
LSKLQQALDDTSLWLLFALAGAGGASMLALGMLLRSSQALTPRMVLGTLLHSAAWAVGVFALTYSRFPEDLPFLVGLSIMSGMGVASFVDLAFLVLRQRLGMPMPPPGAPPPPEHNPPPSTGKAP